MAKSRPVKCPICGESFYRENEPNYQIINNRYYHNKCYLKRKEDEEYKQHIHNYCKKLFGTGYSKRRIDAQIKELTDEGKSITGIYRTLVWHYEHNHGDVTKANCGIRIVNYVYPQAEQYYQHQLELARNRQKIMSQAIVEKEPEVFHINPTPIKKPKRVNLFDIH